MAESWIVNPFVAGSSPAWRAWLIAIRKSDVTSIGVIIKMVALSKLNTKVKKF